jgi:hypothetical protein
MVQADDSGVIFLQPVSVFSPSPQREARRVLRFSLLSSEPAAAGNKPGRGTPVLLAQADQPFRPPDGPSKFSEGPFIVTAVSPASSALRHPF